MLTFALAVASAHSGDVQVHQDAAFDVKVTHNVVYAQALTCNDQYSPLTCTAMDLKLDTYEPEVKAGGIPVPALKPAYIMMHGGGNTQGGKGWVNALAGQWWAERGFVAFDINYRLVGDKGLLPAKESNSSLLQWQPQWASAYPAIRDAKASVRFVRAKAREYGVDPRRIAASGGSAGAADMLAAGVTFEHDYKDELTTAHDPTLASTNLQESSSVQALVLHWAHDDGVLLAQAHNGGGDRYSSSNPPVVSFHGNQDTTIPIQHAYAVQAAYAKTGVTYELHVLDGCPHGSWCYDGKGGCTCTDNVTESWTPLMEELAMPVVVDALDLTLVTGTVV